MSASHFAISRIETSPGRTGHASLAARQAIDRAWCLQYSDPKKAKAAGAEAIALAEAAGTPGDLAHAHFQFAYAAVRLNSRDEALLALVEARTLFEATEDSRGMWLVRAGEAHCARKAGHTDEAINVLRALAADPPVEATAADLFIVHLGLAVAYRFVGLLEPALKWHYQAVDTARDSGAPVLLAMMLSNLGGYHCDLHNPEEGCRMLEQGLELTRICDAGRLTSHLARNLAQCYVELGRNAESLIIAERYLIDDRYAEEGDGPDSNSRLALALAYAHNHRPEDAEREFLLVRPLLVKNGAAEGTPEVFWTLVEARVAIAAGRPRQAADVALATLAQLNENAVDSPFDLMQLHATVSEACESIGDDRRALSHERRRAVIRERLIRLGAHAASLAHTIRHELESTRAERDRITALHAELEREHARLAALNSALTAQIAENLLLHDALKEQNYRDALTGLHNRRYLYERGPRLLEASFLRGVPLCLAMIDLDHFKRLNDMHGHVVGDRVLVALGKVMREGLRENDIVCRVGGEEFAMILTDSTAAARERLKRMLAACAQLRAAEGEEELPSGLSFSAGIVEAPAHCGTIDALMIAADRLLYKAKHNGRARIEAAGYPIRRVLPRASLAVRETIDR